MSEQFKLIKTSTLKKLKEVVREIEEEIRYNEQ